MSSSSDSVSSLGNGVIINGEISSNGVFDVCGNINGKIKVKQLNVQNGGIVTGEILAEKIVISKNGKIEGNISATHIKMLNGSFINGEIYYNIISIEDGSVIEGKCYHLANSSDKKNGKTEAK